MKTDPILVALPNTSEQKMEAIVNLSKAIEELSRALASTHVDVEISNCQISDCELGISVSGVNDAKIRSCHITPKTTPSPPEKTNDRGRPRKAAKHG